MLRLLVLVVPLAYVGWHLWMLAPLPAWGKWLSVGLYVAWVALAFVSLGRWLDSVPMWLSTVVYGVGNAALIVSVYLLLLCLTGDVLRLVGVVPGSWMRDNMVSALSVAALMVVVLVAGNMHYRSKKRVEVSVDSGGRIERPVRMVCASDLHLGYHNRRAELARWVDIINAEHPDAVLLAGDLIDRSLRPLLHEDVAAELRRLAAPVYACLGNHEYYASYYYSSEEVLRFYADAGIELLRDSVAMLDGIAIMGRDDRSNPHRLDVKQLKDRSMIADTQFTILLDHQPYHLEEAEQAGVDFQFSGHTHRGQFWPLSWVTDALYECSWGTHHRGGTAYYVSSGLGIWGPVYRIGTQSEYVVLTIN